MTPPRFVVSLTTSPKRLIHIEKVINSIYRQNVKPDKIYLYLSEDPYILDEGFKDKIITNINLLNFIKTNNLLIEINWEKNIGSYRKLIPLLKKKWNEECIIITIDDDTVYDNDLIKNLVEDYNKHKCVVGYRGFTPKFDTFENFNYLLHDKLENYSLYNFLTGKGGILYKPDFFHKTNDLIFDEKIYLNTSRYIDLNDRQ